MGDCNRCKTPIRGETGVKCRGICGKVYHPTVKCCGMDQFSLNVLDTNKFVKYMCDDCMVYIHNVDLVLRDIQEGVNRSKQNLKEYKNEFERSLKQNERELKLLLEAIETRFDQRFKKMESVQKTCEKNMEEVSKLCKNIGEMENKNKEMCNEIKETIKETNNKATRVTYAQAVTNNKELPEKKKQVPLVLKPKEKQGLEKTKEDLNNNVDPINFKVTSVENRKNGTIVIQSENPEEREKLKTTIANEMSENYEVRIPKEVNYHVVITDMNFKYTEIEIEEKIKRQNQIMEKCKMEIVQIYETKRYNGKIFNAKIKMDYESFVNAISAEKLNIGWERCRVYDGTSITKCYKCQGYNHKAVDCKNQEICYKCHGQHKSKDCNEEIVKKCVNCIKANNILKLNLKYDHCTNDRKCPVYENKLKLKKERMGITA